MALQYKTQGFVFKGQDRLEADRVFSVFTKDFGRLEIVGKAIRKITSKLKGNIEVFSLSEIEFVEGKNKKILIDTSFLKRHKYISENPEKLVIAYKIADTLEGFIKGEEKDEKIWDFISDIFAKLDTQETNSKFLYYYFFWNFISLLGYEPKLSKCVTCSQKLQEQSLYFSNKEGGIVCGACSKKEISLRKINADVVKILRLILKKDFSTASKLKVELASKKLLKQISDGYLNYLLHTHSSVNKSNT